METDMHVGMFFELLQEREIGIIVGFLENVLEIAAGLVRVDEQSKMESLRHGDSFSFYFLVPTMIASRAIL